MIPLLAALAWAWTLLVLLAPLQLPPGTVQGLDGRANFMDYTRTWAALPAPARLAYTVGDYVCHQDARRSLSLNGNQMPVDQRILAASFGIPLGLVASLRATPRPRARDTLASLLPSTLRARADSGFWLLWAAALLPTGLDAGLELLTDYESSLGLRLVTGLLLGGLAALLSGLTWASLNAPDGEPTRPRGMPRQAG